MKDKLVNNINLASTKIRPYKGFIFLCGGPADIKNPKPISIRDALCRELEKNPEIGARLALAEHYKDWADDSIYRDLMLFEKHIAELSSVIVLALESPGAIAELGLFSIIKEFQEKLLLFVDTNYYQSDSFIRLGPINYLEKQHGNMANCHSWLKSEFGRLVYDPDLVVGLQSELAEAVLERANNLTKERSFNPSAWLDITLLICDLINLNSALTLREIKDFLVDFNISWTESDVRQSLFLLEKLKLISMQPKGEQRFYIRNQSDEFMSFHVKDKAFDLFRFRSDVLDLYRRNDKKRFRAIQEARQSNAKQQ